MVWELVTVSHRLEGTSQRLSELLPAWVTLTTLQATTAVGLDRPSIPKKKKKPLEVQRLLGPCLTPIVCIHFVHEDARAQGAVTQLLTGSLSDVHSEALQPAPGILPHHPIPLQGAISFSPLQAPLMLATVVAPCLVHI